MAEQTYEQRYCAFIDVLGFTGLISSLGNGKLTVEALRALLNVIHKPRRLDYIAMYGSADLRSQSISDAVCMSAACNGPGLAHLIGSIEQLAFSLLRKGYFIRGAVVKGHLYHDENVVFGDALIQAYNLEQGVVRYPRIMVTREVVNDAIEFHADQKLGPEFDDAIEHADDGPYFLNILRFPVALLKNADEDERDAVVHMINSVSKQIQKRFDEAVDNPRHFEKIQWFAGFWNRTVLGYDDVVGVDAPRLDVRLLGRDSD